MPGEFGSWTAEECGECQAGCLAGLRTIGLDGASEQQRE